jgi:Ca2+-binding RTX toxin-like protein
METVLADGDDTVLVADAAVMNDNARSDENDDDTVAEDIQLSTYLDYDTLDENFARVPFVEQTAAEITDVINQNQFTFDLSYTGDGNDNDTVDYKAEEDDIAAVVMFDDSDEQYILVGGNNFIGLGDLTRPQSRIDKLVGVENIVASQGESILDLTNAVQNLKITFSNNYDPNTDWDATFTVDAAGDPVGLEIHEINVADATTGTSVLTRNFLDYVLVDEGDFAANADSAVWTTIEGSDYSETVEMSGWEAGLAHTLNLRGGSNKVSYEGDAVAITIDVLEWDEAQPTTTGLVTIDADHTAPGDDHDATTLVDPSVVATDTITSYSSQNEIAQGSLTIKGARGDQDSVAFAGGLGDEKYFVLGGVVDATSAITVTIGSGDDANSLSLIGFEELRDARTDDVYTIDDLDNVLDDLELVDSPNDRDTLVLEDDDAIGEDSDLAGGVDADDDEISLSVLNDTLSMDFDVLDITGITEADFFVTGDTRALRDMTGDGNNADDVILGNLNLISDAAGEGVKGFQDLWLTEASITSTGSSYILDTAAAELQESDGDLIFETDARGINASLVATDITLEGDVGAVVFVGGSGDDTLIGGTGNDVIRGGVGVDEVAGGGDEVLNTYTVDMFNLAAGGGNITILGQVIATVAGDGPDEIGLQFEAIDAEDFDLGVTAAPVAVIYDESANSLLFTFDYDASAEFTAFDVGSTDATMTIAAPAEVDAYAEPGAGDDVFVVVGAISEAQAAAYDLLFANQAAVDAAIGTDGIVALGELVTETADTDDGVGEVYDGGAGNNTLVILGAVDLSDDTLVNVNELTIGSTLITTKEQLFALKTINTLDDDVIIALAEGELEEGETETSVLTMWANVAGNTLTGPIQVPQYDEDGEPMVDEDGNPVYVTFDPEPAEGTLTEVDLEGVDGSWTIVTAAMTGAGDTVQVTCSGFDDFAGKGETVQTVNLPSLDDVYGTLAINNFVLGDDSLTVPVGTNLASEVTEIFAVLGETVDSIGAEGSDTYVSFALQLASGGTVLLNNIVNIDSLFSDTVAAAVEANGIVDVTGYEATLIGVIDDSIVFV